MKGPEGTPYAGGTYKLDIFFGESYPMQPPCCRLATRIYHPNVDRIGRICLDILHDKWSPALQVCNVISAVSDLLKCPDVYDAADETIARHFRDNLAGAEEEAKNWNTVHAMADEGEAFSESSSSRILQLHATLMPQELIHVTALSLAGEVVRDISLDGSSTVGDLHLALDLLSLGSPGPAQQYDALQLETYSRGLGFYGPPDLQYIRTFSSVRLLVGDAELCAPDDMLLKSTSLWPHSPPDDNETAVSLEYSPLEDVTT